MLDFSTRYSKNIQPQLTKEFGYHPMQVPKIVKVVINIGAGEAVHDSKVIDLIANDLKTIAGQKPVIKKARKSIASFKLREGMPVGCMVTLRRKKMYSFMERLVYSALPRSREFKGFSSKSFDGRGNFSFGLKEQIIFPEINYDKIDKVRGMDITIVTSATTNEEGKALLQAFDFPFYN